MPTIAKNMVALIDTNVLLAYAYAKDSRHIDATRLIRSLRGEQRIVPQSVLSELFYMVTIRMSYDEAVKIFAVTRLAFQIEPLVNSDMARMEQIMVQYQDAKLDFVDVSIFALAERLNIRRICTFDRRDFSIFRPTHCDYFELLP